MNQFNDIDIDSIDASGFEKINTGFLPYWVPELKCAICSKKLDTHEVFCPAHPPKGEEMPKLKGNRFYGTILEVDKGDGSDEAFIRYTVQSLAKMQGQTGKKDSPTIVTVHAGEHFTVGSYGALGLDKLVGTTIFVTVVGKQKNKDKPRNAPMFVFDVRMDPKSAKKSEYQPGSNNGSQTSAVPFG